MILVSAVFAGAGDEAAGNSGGGLAGTRTALSSGCLGESVLKVNRSSAVGGSGGPASRMNSMGAVVLSALTATGNGVVQRQASGSFTPVRAMVPVALQFSTTGAARRTIFDCRFSIFELDNGSSSAFAPPVSSVEFLPVSGNCAA